MFKLNGCFSYYILHIPQSDRNLPQGEAGDRYASLKEWNKAHIKLMIASNLVWHDYYKGDLGKFPTVMGKWCVKQFFSVSWICWLFRLVTESFRALTVLSQSLNSIMGEWYILLMIPLITLTNISNLINLYFFKVCWLSKGNHGGFFPAHFKLDEVVYHERLLKRGHIMRQSGMMAETLL